MRKGTGAGLSRAGYRENRGVGPAAARTACLGEVGACAGDLNDKDPPVSSGELELYPKGTVWSGRRKMEPYSGDHSLGNSKKLIWEMRQTPGLEENLAEAEATLFCAPARTCMLNVCRAPARLVEHSPLPGQHLGSRALVTSQVSYGCHVPCHCPGSGVASLPAGTQLVGPGPVRCWVPCFFNRHCLLSLPELCATSDSVPKLPAGQENFRGP